MKKEARKRSGPPKETGDVHAHVGLRPSVVVPGTDTLTPVTGEHWLELFDSEGFGTLLRAAAEFTGETGREAGIVAIRHHDRNEHQFLELQKGGLNDIGESFWEDGTAEEEVFDQIASAFEGRPLSFLMLNLHTHFSGSIAPSDVDLFSLAAMKEYGETPREDTGRGISASPLAGIARINEDKSVDVLLIQERSIKPLSEELIGGIVDDIEGKVDETDPQFDEKFCQALNESGFYRATFVRFLPNAGSYRLRKSDAGKLSMFAFTPTLT